MWVASSFLFLLDEISRQHGWAPPLWKPCPPKRCLVTFARTTTRNFLTWCPLFWTSNFKLHKEYIPNKRLNKPLLVVRVGPGTNPKYGSHWTESLIATWKKKRKNKKEKEMEPKLWLVVPRVTNDWKNCLAVLIHSCQKRYSSQVWLSFGFIFYSLHLWWLYFKICELLRLSQFPTSIIVISSVGLFLFLNYCINIYLMRKLFRCHSFLSCLEHLRQNLLCWPKVCESYRLD